MSLRSGVPHFLRYLELYLTAAGLALILAVPRLFPPTDQVLASAVTATLVGLVHGLLFWLVRRRQRQMREALVMDLQGMLKDRINNQLQVVLIHADGSEPELSADDQARLGEISRAVREVSSMLDMLSLESLTSWQRRYPHVTGPAAAP